MRPALVGRACPESFSGASRLRGRSRFGAAKARPPASRRRLAIVGRPSWPPPPPWLRLRRAVFSVFFNFSGVGLPRILFGCVPPAWTKPLRRGEGPPACRSLCSLRRRRPRFLHRGGHPTALHSHAIAPPAIHSPASTKSIIASTGVSLTSLRGPATAISVAAGQNDAATGCCHPHPSSNTQPQTP